MIAEMVDCSAPASWWPIVVVSLLIGVAIGLGIGNWIMAEVRREHSMERAKMQHPGWSGHVGWDETHGRGDGGGRGEMWEVE